jgi:hypothetical protein
MWSLIYVATTFITERYLAINECEVAINGTYSK